MGKGKNIWNGEHGGFFKYAALMTALALAFLLFGPGPNLVRWARARLEIARQERMIRQYEKEIGEMGERYRHLSTDRDSLEQFARERFHLAAPGDDVYILEK